MNIQTVAANLRNTIAGKEFLLEKMQQGTDSQDAVDRAVASATMAFLKINIDELKRILADVETCCLQAREDSWRLNPDRMGGQFTQDELNREWN